MGARNVVLIGFMGAGKTAVGEALGAHLGWPVYDTDAMVEHDAGKSITQIWADGGEEAFRALEYDAILRACAGVGRVIACGGGAVLQLRAYGILKGAGTIVYLRAPANELKQRVGDASDRPLLAGKGAFERLLTERAPAYESAADLIVDVSGKDPGSVAEEIVGLIA